MRRAANLIFTDGTDFDDAEGDPTHVADAEGDATHVADARSGRNGLPSGETFTALTTHTSRWPMIAAAEAHATYALPPFQIDVRWAPPDGLATEVAYSAKCVGFGQYHFYAPHLFAAEFDLVRQTATALLRQREAASISLRNLLRIGLLLSLQSSGGLALHSAARVYETEAWAFFGRSGVGKSTLAKGVPAGALLADELTAIDAQGVVHRTPFYGEVAAPSASLSAPLTALFALEQAARVRLSRLPEAQAVRALLSATMHLTTDPASTAALTDRVIALAQKYPVWRLALPKVPAAEHASLIAGIALQLREQGDASIV